MNRSGNRMTRKSAVSMDELIRRYIDDMKISAGLNTHLVFTAWDEVSGAGRYTIGRYFRDGKLYITLSSSMVRNQLSFQKNDMIRRMNQILAQDSLFSSDNPRVSYVKELILK